MMHEYNLIKSSTNTSLKSSGTKAQPSKHVVQNILRFARCYQNVVVKDVKFRLSLN